MRWCSREDQRLFGFELLLSASALGDALAIFTLVERGLKRNSLHEPLYADALRRLNVLAKEDRNRRAMLLLGKVLSAQGKSSDALKHFRSATRLSSENGEYFLTFEGAGEALVLEGRMLSDQGDKTGSKTAFQKAALELDEPSAFYHLAMGEEADSSSRKIYLMKAASSGILEACHELGSLELKQMEEGPDVAKSPSLSDYGMAREWFQVAASGGFGPSMLSLALICKSAGRREEGLRWLETAKALPEFRTQALAWESLGKMND
ncbi:hypothetical protein DH86_00002763 [Scytalidium sp. 3C]|nr:hypothetical protein DH86_00002763 [Scytalidium sp. 3C]